LKLNVGYQNNIRKEFGNPENPSETELEFDLRTWTSSLQWRLPEAAHFETTVGVSGMHQRNINKGEETIIPQYTSRDGGLFLFTQKSVKDVTFSGGARFDMRRIHSEELMDGTNLKFAPFKKTFSNVSASAGLSYHPTPMLTYKANVARGFRAPALSELASNGAHEGTNRYEYGNLDLNSERSFQIDAGIEVDFEHLGFTLSLFQNAIKDFIFYRRLQGVSGDSLVTVDGGDLEAFQYDQQGANLSGLEASMDLHPHPLDWLHIKNTVSLIRARFNHKIDGSDNLPMIPAARYLGELRVNLINGKKAVRNVYGLVELDKTFRQNKPFFGYNTETATPGYTLLNAGIGSDFYGNGKPFMHIYIAANNLTDVAYQSHLSRLKYAAVNNVTGRRGVFNTGRNISIRVHIPFSYSTKK
jgi:iron complex outermembrane receptor protein